MWRELPGGTGSPQPRLLFILQPGLLLTVTLLIATAISTGNKWSGFNSGNPMWCNSLPTERLPKEQGIQTAHRRISIPEQISNRGAGLDDSQTECRTLLCCKITTLPGPMHHDKITTNGGDRWSEIGRGGFITRPIAGIIGGIGSWVEREGTGEHS